MVLTIGDKATMIFANELGLKGFYAPGRICIHTDQETVQVNDFFKDQLGCSALNLDKTFSSNTENNRAVTIKLPSTQLAIITPRAFDYVFMGRSNQRHLL